MVIPVFKKLTHAVITMEDALRFAQQQKTIRTWFALVPMEKARFENYVKTK